MDPGTRKKEGRKEVGPNKIYFESSKKQREKDARKGPLARYVLR